MTVSSHAAIVLQPLTKATERYMQPVRVGPKDHMWLWLDEKGSGFYAQLYSQSHTGDWHSRATVGADLIFDKMPEREWLGKKDPGKKFRYKVAGTDFNALILHELWPQDRLHFGFGPGRPHSDDAATLYKYLVTRFMAQTQRAEMVARYRLEDQEPPRPDDWVDHPDEELRLENYQRSAALMGLAADETALFMDRGTGKTPTAIQIMCMRAIRKYAADGGMLKTLIVCPPQVCLNWKNEIRRFAVCRGKVAVVRGGSVKRLKALTQGITSEDGLKFSALVISYDAFVRSCEDFSRVPWDMVIADESHFFKSPRTQRWREGMRPIRDVARFKLALTGTPIGNSPMDLWSQLEFLGEGLSGFVDYRKFKNFHGSWEAVGNTPGVEKLVGLKEIPLIKERLTRVSFQITKEQAGLNLPPKAYDIYEVEMTKAQKEIYDRVAGDLAVEFEDRVTGEMDEMTIQNVLTSLLRLSQVTSGHAVFDAKHDLDTGDELQAKRVHQINDRNPKVEAVVDMLTADDRDPNGKTVVWCCWKPNFQVLSDRLTELGIVHGVYNGSTPTKLRDELVDRFNGDPEFKVLLANPQSAAEGLNLLGYDHWNKSNAELPTNCDHQIIFSQGWSANLRGQLEDRAHRRGTRCQVRITDLVVPGTIDEEIRDRLFFKRDMALDTLDVKDVLSRVLGI